MIGVFLAWLRLVKADPANLKFHVHIHETADASAAERYWADVVDGVGSFGGTSIKKHNPLTNRQNTGEHYHGCLVVRVNKGADLYRRIEGWWCGIVGAAQSPDQSNRT
jgi:hypothetical protein